MSSTTPILTSQEMLQREYILPETDKPGKLWKAVLPEIIIFYSEVNADKIKYPVFACLLLLTGCFPKDELVVPLKLDIVEIPYSMYDTQAWYNLHDKTVVSHNSFNDWDLGFESNGSGASYNTEHFKVHACRKYRIVRFLWHHNQYL